MTTSADNALADLEKMISGLSDADKAALDAELSKELNSPFLPNPGPQSVAFNTKADMVLYGGAAGGGKTALTCGLGVTKFKRSLIVRRQAVELDGIVDELETSYKKYGKYVGGAVSEFKCRDGRNIKLGGMRDAGAWKDYAGRARDLMAFDEAGEFTREQVFSLRAWNRSTDPNQHCMTLLGSNPPRGGEGDWLIMEFAPWLDPLHALYPAKAGELIYAIVVGGDTEWVEGPGEYNRDGEIYEAESRTFIPAFLNDNPYLRDTDYRRKLQALPEPLRSQLLYGDFTAGRVDDDWQVIPSKWVRAAQDRHKKAEVKNRRMHALAIDPSGEGPDPTVLGSLHADNWFAPLTVLKTMDGTPGQAAAAQVLMHRRDRCDVSIDMTGGWGGNLHEALYTHHKVMAHKWVFSEGSGGTSEDRTLGFSNIRSELLWSLREALDPESGEDIMLPPDERLFAELTAPRWRMLKARIRIESKEDIKKRIGASTDRADTIMMAWGRRHMITFIDRQQNETFENADMSDPFEDILFGD